MTTFRSSRSATVVGPRRGSEADRDLSTGDEHVQDEARAAERSGAGRCSGLPRGRHQGAPRHQGAAKPVRVMVSSGTGIGDAPCAISRRYWW
ncbi:MAG: hypothetical protein MZV63_09775 [Marinilabiliales bacterium]|nr:hypothetical protein [Marinilabiliales bacterium]